MITVARPLAVDEIKRLGFEPAEAIRTDQSSSGADVLRFERGAGDAVQFIELAVRDRAVQAVGWTRVLSKADAAEASRAVLGEFGQRFGFPDDIVAEQDIHAVGWMDRERSLRMELILQPSDDAGSSWELSAVLRRSN